MLYTRAFFALALLGSCALAACGGIGSGFTPARGSTKPTTSPAASPSASASPAPSTSPATATVDFTVVVPPSGLSARRRPNFIAPSSAASLSFNLDSVNGSTSSVTPTVVNLTTATSGCTESSGQLTCSIDVGAPAGALVYTARVYSAANAGGTLLGEGNAAVTAVAGQTVDAPLTLTGTVVHVAVTVSGTAPEGYPTSVPVTVQAIDANGATIIGTYSSPVTLTDTDSESDTTVSPASIPDSTTAATATLTYNGSIMTSPATLTVSSGSSTATTNFTPDVTIPTVDNATITFAESGGESANENAAPSAPTLVASPSATYTYATGQSFNSATNLVSISVNGETYYYTWVPSGTSAAYQYVGLSNPNDYQTQTCVSPYETLGIAPLPGTGSGWSVYPNTGTCTLADNVELPPIESITGSTAQNADGSYLYQLQFDIFATTENNTATVTSSDGATLSFNDSSGTSLAATVSPPSGSAMAVSYVEVAGPLPSPLPAPTATTVPSILTSANSSWMFIPTTGPQSPLLSDVFTVKGSVSTPAVCLGAGSMLTGVSTVTEVDETYYQYDVAQYDESPYVVAKNQHYYVPGLGDACDSETYDYLDYDDSIQSWIDGTDQNYDTSIYSVTDYATASTLAPELAHRATTGASTASGYALFALAADARERSFRGAVIEKRLKRLINDKRKRSE